MTLGIRTVQVSLYVRTKSYPACRNEPLRRGTAGAAWARQASRRNVAEHAAFVEDELGLFCG